MLDGNALAGALTDLLGEDPTAQRARCAGCGATEALARVAVYVSAMGTVARCPHCDTVVAVVVEAEERRWVRLPAALELPAAAPAVTRPVR